MAVYGALDGGLHARGRGAAGAPPPYEVIIVAERGEAGLAHFLTLWRAQPLFAFSLVDTPEAEGQLARAGMAVCWRSNQVWWLELPPEVCAAAASGTAAGTAATTAAAAATAAAAGHHRHRQTPPQPTPLATPRPTGSTPQCRRRCGATLTPTGGEAEDAVGRMLAGPTEFACTVTAQVRRSGHSVSELQLQPGRRDPTFRATLPRVRGCSFVSYIGMSCQGSGC